MTFVGPYERVQELWDEALTRSPAEAGAFWAERILQEVGPEEEPITSRTHRMVVLTAVDAAVRDLSIAESLLASLGAAENRLEQRFSDDLYAALASRALGWFESRIPVDIAAQAELVSWALNQVSDSSVVLTAMMEAVSRRSDPVLQARVRKQELRQILAVAQGLEDRIQQKLTEVAENQLTMMDRKPTTKFVKPTESSPLDDPQFDLLWIAESPEEFWNNFVTLFNTHIVEAKNIREYYEKWRKRLIKRRFSQHIEQIRDENDWNTVDFPEECGQVTVRLDGYVSFSGVATLCAAIRSYFVAAAGLSLVDSPIEISQKLKEGESAAEIIHMETLVEKVTSWYASEDTTLEIGTAYSYWGDQYPELSPGLFYQHRMRIERLDNELRLRFIGNEALQDFSAFSNETAHYDEIQLTYPTPPPDDIIDLRLLPPATEEDIAGWLELPFPAEEVARHIQGICELSDSEMSQVIAALETPNESGNQLTAIPMEKIVLEISNNFPYIQRNEKLIVGARVREEVKELRVGLPIVKVNIKVREPTDKFNKMAVILFANALKRREQTGSFRNGKLDNNIFQFNPYISEVIKSRDDKITTFSNALHDYQQEVSRNSRRM